MCCSANHNRATSAHPDDRACAIPAEHMHFLTNVDDIHPREVDTRKNNIKNRPKCGKHSVCLVENF